MANASAAATIFFRVSASDFSVRFRVIPWLVFILFCPFLAPAKPPKLTSFLAGHLVIKRGRKIIENFTKIMIRAFATLFLNSILQSNFS